MPTPVATPDLTFIAPGPGSWKNDRSHCLGSITPVVQQLMSESMRDGMRRVFAELGVPADTLECRFVHGFMYTRLRPIISGDKATTKLPPVPLLKLATRVHPEMRRRARTAAATLAERPWRAIAQEWESTIRPRLQQQNLALQDVDLRALDDDAVAHHLDAVYRHNRATWEEHFRLHGYDLGPIGMLVFETQKLGVPIATTAAALEGASPSSSAPARTLTQLRAIACATHPVPTTVQELRSISPEADRLLCDYLRTRGNMIVSRYDVDGRTLNEVPGLVMRAILDGHQGRHGDDVAARTDLIGAVPAHDRARITALLDDARDAMDLRDDNGPNTIEWPLGLLRLAMAEAGRRLHAVGRLVEADHSFELLPDELRALLTSGAGPTAAAVAERAAARRSRQHLRPPLTLGPDEAEPPLDALPTALATLVATVNSVIAQLGMDGSARDDDSLAGTGVGRVKRVGRACVADSPEAAMAALEMGDILVVPFTTPAYNVILPLAGGIVTVDGGPLSHAAVLARELGIPAVIGVPGALAQIHHHDEIEIDPAKGVVHVLARSV